MAETDEPEGMEQVVEVPIDGTLDLHTFAPREIADLVSTYLDECRARSILEVRIIHGKGTGTQRRIVQKVLERHPAVRAFRSADERSGGWGATLVDLLPP
ncbi:MAG: Smr/MutS family protein [Myxococcales bacterium]